MLMAWQHIAFVLKSGICYVEKSIPPLDSATKINRTLNYVGTDYYGSKKYLADAFYGRINLYYGAMTADKVMSEYKTESDLNFSI